MKITVDIQRGRLGEFSFPMLLHALYVQGAGGALLLSHMGRSKTVYFEEGWPVFVQSDVSAEKLDHFLIDKQVLTAEEAQEALRQSIEETRTLGEVLITSGAVEPFELYKYLRQIFARSLLDVFRWEDGDWHWKEGEALPENELRLKMNPAQLNLMGIENFVANERVAETFSPVEGQEWILNPRSPYALDALKLNPKETRLITLLRKPQSLPSLLKESEMELPLLRKKLYSLELLEILCPPARARTFAAAIQSEPEPEAVTTPARPAEAPALPAVPAAPSVLDEAAVREHVLAAFDEIKESNHFEFFGVTKETAPETLRKIFYEFIHRANPFNVKDSPDADLRRKCEQVFLHAMTAYETLADPLRRTNYLAKIEAPERMADGTPVAPQAKKDKKPGAAFAIKTDMLKGDQHLKNGLKALEEKRYPKAVEFFQFACDVEPSVTHNAHLTYARFMVNPMRQYEDTAEIFEKMLKKEPDHEAANYLYAQVLRQMGDYDGATKRLKEVLRINGAHPSANREIVVIRKEAEEKKKKKGFFRR